METSTVLILGTVSARKKIVICCGYVRLLEGNGGRNICSGEDRRNKSSPVIFLSFRI